MSLRLKSIWLALLYSLSIGSATLHAQVLLPYVDNSNGHPWSVSDPVGGFVQRLKAGDVADSYEFAITKGQLAPYFFSCFMKSRNTGDGNHQILLRSGPVHWGTLEFIPIANSSQGSIRVRQNGVIVGTLGSFNNDQWYKVTAYMDFANHSISWQINDAASLVTGIFPDTITGLSAVKIQSFGTFCEGFYDNLFVGHNPSGIGGAVNVLPTGSRLEIRDSYTNMVVDNPVIWNPNGNNGSYSSAPLYPGVYQVTPVEPYFSFSPPSRSVEVGADWAGADFSAVPLPPYDDLPMYEGFTNSNWHESWASVDAGEAATLTENDPIGGRIFRLDPGVLDPGNVFSLIYKNLPRARLISCNIRTRNRFTPSSNYNSSQINLLNARRAGELGSELGWFSFQYSGGQARILLNGNPATVSGMSTFQDDTWYKVTAVIDDVAGTVAWAINGGAPSTVAFLAPRSERLQLELLQAGAGSASWLDNIYAGNDMVGFTGTVNGVPANSQVEIREAFTNTVANLPRTGNSSGGYISGTLFPGIFRVTPIEPGYDYTPPSRLVETGPAWATADFNAVIRAYTLTTPVTGTGSVTKTPNRSTYDHGASVTLTAVENTASTYRFVRWTEGAATL